MAECCSPLRELECRMGMFGDLLKHRNPGPPCTKCNTLSVQSSLFNIPLLHLSSWSMNIKNGFPKPVPKFEGSKSTNMDIPLAVSDYICEHTVQPLFGEWFRNILNQIKVIFKAGTDSMSHNKNRIVWWQFSRDQFSLLSFLLACWLMTYWLFISTYKANILHDHILHP